MSSGNRTSPPIKLVVGLGNPGREYEDTRHNVGVWYVEALARHLGVTLTPEKKYFGLTGSATVDGEKVHLLIPTTYMNRSGQATSALANFFKTQTEEMLVAHDELDLPPGSIRLKQGGGHGGHNGLRDIISRHGNNRNFVRLRIGIGHPGNAELVTPHVLNRPSGADRQKIESAIDEAVACSDRIMAGELGGVMNTLNAFRA
jgi:PTH1 family peptidyl-tRNA hydrolase